MRRKQTPRNATQIHSDEAKNIAKIDANAEIRNGEHNDCDGILLLGTNADLNSNWRRLRCQTLFVLFSFRRWVHANIRTNNVLTRTSRTRNDAGIQPAQSMNEIGIYLCNFKVKINRMSEVTKCRPSQFQLVMNANWVYEFIESNFCDFFFVIDERRMLAKYSSWHLWNGNKRRVLFNGGSAIFSQFFLI